MYSFFTYQFENLSGRPSADPTHPDFVPNIFKFKKLDESKFKMQLKRYESAGKRAKYEHKPNESATNKETPMDLENPIEYVFDVIDSDKEDEAQPSLQVNQAMEIDNLRSEKNFLMTKISCLEQQVCR